MLSAREYSPEENARAFYNTILYQPILDIYFLFIFHKLSKYILKYLIDGKKIVSYVYDYV